MLLQTLVAGAPAGYRGCTARARSLFHAPARRWSKTEEPAMGLGTKA